MRYQDCEYNIAVMQDLGWYLKILEENQIDVHPSSLTGNWDVNFFISIVSLHGSYTIVNCLIIQYELSDKYIHNDLNDNLVILIDKMKRLVVGNSSKFWRHSQRIAFMHINLNDLSTIFNSY